MKASTRIVDAEADRLVKKCLEDPKLAERRDLLALFLQGNFSPQFTKQMVLHLIIAAGLGKTLSSIHSCWADTHELKIHAEGSSNSTLPV